MHRKHEELAAAAVLSAAALVPEGFLDGPITSKGILRSGAGPGSLLGSLSPAHKGDTWAAIRPTLTDLPGTRSPRTTCSLRILSYRERTTLVAEVDSHGAREAPRVGQ
jgi:hypothetical protein